MTLSDHLWIAAGLHIGQNVLAAFNNNFSRPCVGQEPLRQKEKASLEQRCPRNLPSADGGYASALSRLGWHGCDS